MRYGRYTTTGVREKRKNHYYLECVCDCGTVKFVRESSLKSGVTRSCGCLAKEVARERLSSHGFSSHPLYQRWCDMNRRCYNPQRKDFQHYGGRGISVCDEWVMSNPDGFLNFVNDMGSTFFEGLEIDREDNDGNYHVGNCRWVDRRTQVLNSRNVHFKTTDVGDLARKYNLPISVVSDRITKLGWTSEEAVSKPVRVKRYFLHVDGEMLKLSDYLSRDDVIKFSNIKRSKGVEYAMSALGIENLELHAETLGEIIKLYPQEELFNEHCKP